MQKRQIISIDSSGYRLHAWIIGDSETAEKTIVLLHGGGPDHEMWLPLVAQLPLEYRVILPDIRGYGLSICRDPAQHTWSQYAADVVALLDHLGLASSIVGGAGLGGTIALRAAIEYPDRISALMIISLEDIEDDDAKLTEIRMMDAFAEGVRNDGIEAAWAPLLKELPPVIGTMVRDAIPHSDPESIAAAAAIGRDRSFQSAKDLAAITVPTLIVPGIDSRHPTELAKSVAELLPQGQLASVQMSPIAQTAADFAEGMSPTINNFLRRIRQRQKKLDSY